MDAYDYEKIQSLKRLGCKVDCITAYYDTLLVAVRDKLLQFKIQSIYEINRNQEKVRLNGPNTFKVFAKPVVEMYAVPEFSLLIAVYDSMLNVYDLESYIFKMSLSNTKGVDVTALSVQNEVDSHGIYDTNLKICVAMGKKLLILEWTGDCFIEISTDCVMSKYVKSLVWCKTLLFIGFKDGYMLLKPESGHYKDIFALGNNLHEPLMTMVDDDTVLLGYDNTSVFVNSRGNPAKDECIQWTGIPTHIEHDSPYVLAVLSRYLEVRTVSPSVSIQQMEIKHVNAVCQAKDAIFLQCKDAIYMLTLRPRRDRIKGLVKHKHFENAIEIKMKDMDISMEERLADVNKIQGQYAVHLFCIRKFKEAMEIFSSLGTDPSHVIGMFPDLLPAKLRRTLEYPEKLPSMQAKDLDKALLELVDYLQTKREELVNEKDLKAFVPIMEHKRNDTLKNKEQALTVIDTTLLKCYLQINKAMVVPLLCMPGNKVHYKEAKKVLKDSAKYSMLIVLYEQNHMHDKALDVLKCRAGTNSSLQGLQPTIQKLQELGEANLNLIFEYAEWVMATDPLEGLKIFIAEVSTVRELPRGHVASFIGKFGIDVVVGYLEHVIYTWNDLTVELHLSLEDHLRNRVSKEFTTYALLHVHDVKQAKAGEEDGVLGLYRRKFIKFLKTSTVYQPEAVLIRLPLDSFFDERSILLGEMGKHKEALGIYVYILEDAYKAEEYCVKYYNKGSSEVYLDLLHVYVHPPKPLALGLTEYKHPPKPRIQTALSMLETHATKINMHKALETLPEEILIKKSHAVLEAAIDRHVSRRYLGQVLKQIQFQEYLQVSVDCMEGSRKCVKVNEYTNCGICKRKIGSKSVFVCSANSELVHYGCYNNKIPVRVSNSYNQPVLDDTSHN